MPMTPGRASPWVADPDSFADADDTDDVADLVDAFRGVVVDDGNADTWGCANPVTDTARRQSASLFDRFDGAIDGDD